MSNRTFALVIAGVLATAPSVALADGPSDLAACQATVSSASADLVQTLTDRVERCLQKVSAAVITDGASTSDAAAASAEKCVALFRGLRNSKRPRKQAGKVFDAAVGAACDPAVNPLLLHAEADTWTIGSRTLGAAGLASSCGHFGRGGSIASFAGWRDCLRTATECQAHQAVALRWPRALEYFAALKTAIAGAAGGRGARRRTGRPDGRGRCHRRPRRRRRARRGLRDAGRRSRDRADDLRQVRP